MKKFKRILYSAVAAVCLLSALGMGYSADGESLLEIKKGIYTLSVDEDNCTFVLKTETGEEWKSNPDEQATNKSDEVKSLIILETVDKDNFETSLLTSYYECVESGDYTVSRRNDSIDIIFNFTEIKTTVPLSLSLDETGLTVTLKASDIKIKDDNVFLKSISVLPFFGAAGRNETGYMLIPDGSGALINFGDSNAKQSYSGEIYGSDLADLSPSAVVCEKISMPVFGIKRSDSSLFAIVTDGEADCSVLAAANGQKTDFANAYIRVNIGESAEFDLGINKTTIFESGPFKNKNVTLRYSVLPGDTSYVDMAKEYRDYLKSIKGFKEKTTAKTSLFLDVWAGVVEKKSAFLFTYNGYTVLTDGKALENMIAELTSAGVENIKVRYLGAEKNEAFSKIVNGVTLHSKLKYNGKSALWGDKISGVTVYPTVESLMTFTNENYIFSKAGKGVKNIADINVRLTGTVDAFGNSIGKERYILNPDNLFDTLRTVNRDLKNKNMKYFGISDLGNSLYSHYGNAPVKKDSLKDKIVSELQSISKNSRINMENPNIYAAAFADSITGAPMGSSGCDLFSEDVPFWQIVMSAFSEYSGNILNLGFDKADILKLIETGTSPRFGFVAAGSKIPISTGLSENYSADFGVWKNKAAETYSLISSATAITGGSTIENHRRISDCVYLTEFANGSQIYVNYGNESFILPDGRTIGAQDFLGGEASE